MRVLFVTPEVTPFSGTGGLGEVSAALPKALRKKGLQVSVLSPFYRSASEQSNQLAQALSPLKFRLGSKQLTANLLQMTGHDGVRQLFIDIPKLYDRSGLYGDGDAGFADNAERFAVLSKSAVAISQQYDMAFEVVHCHDWQSALMPMYRRTVKTKASERGKQAVVFTIHNMAFQGVTPLSEASRLGIPKSYSTEKGLEFYGNLNLMKAGILYSDVVTTVSPKYASEICTEEFGCGLDGLLTQRRDNLHGILNGVDYGVWSPEHDQCLEYQYDAQNQNGKRRCKAALQARFGLAIRPRIPLLGVVSRLAEQKGTDLLIPALDELVEKHDIQAVILGTGENGLEQSCRDLAARHPSKVAVKIGYDVRLAHEIFAGADLYPMPSRFEPCGLSQLYAMRYGAIPIVRDTGGLHDTVQDYNPETGKGTGFHFKDATVESLVAGISRALDEFGVARNWRRLVATAMGVDFSWDRAADSYIDVYERVLEGKT